MVQHPSLPYPSSAGRESSRLAPSLVLVDGHSLAFRSYYAFAKGQERGLRTSTGIPTSICFGFLHSLLSVMELQQPQLMAVAFDLELPTFRHEADHTYKADRVETPEDFLPDLKNLQQLLTALNLQVITSAGYEADDVLATLAHRGSEAGYQVKIVTGDRDLFQLVDSQKQVTVLYLDRNLIKGASTATTTEFGPEEVEKKLEIQPAQVVDYKALCGDKSDNIPGVKGIGEKSAVKLLREYGSLEGIYQNLDQIKGATQKKLAAGKEDAQHSRYLAQLKFDAPLELGLEACRLQGFDAAKLKPLLEKLEMKKFLRQVDHLQQQFGGKLIEETDSSAEWEEDEQLWFFSPEDTQKEQSRASTQTTPQIIDTPQKLTELVEQLQRYTDTPVAWDTETTALKPRQAKLVGIGCCWGESPRDVAYIPIGHTNGSNFASALETLRPLLENSNYPKVLQNAKFDRLVFWHQGVNLRGVVFDPMLASYVLHPERNHNLGELARRYYLPEIELKSYKDLEIPKGETIAELDIETTAAYCGMDAYVTFRLVPEIQAELAEIPALHKLFQDVEMPLESVLAEMEYWGIRIDTGYLEALSQQLEEKLQGIEQTAFQQAGEKFNLGSPKQLSELLFNQLDLDRRKSRKTKTGYSTDHATLEKLRGDHPVVDAVLEYRTLAKLKSTYVDALPGLVDAETQRIYTDFNQAVTTTGRLSSSNPNLQNIPTRTEFSRQIRKAFVPKDDWLLVTADYSQIELRILAHFSGEPVLVEAYQNKRDVHTVTAKLLFEKEEITAEERRLGKVINFGVIYGMGAQRFAREAGVSAARGKEFIERYRERYPKVFEYLETRKKNAIARGYVETILGRRRYFNFGSESIQRLRGSTPEEIDLDHLKPNREDAESLRAAANAPIQGSSSDIIKIAMVKLHQILQSYQARLLLQVHDELVFEIPQEEWEELQPQISSTMESAVQLQVPLFVEMHVGKNWMETK
ncbi:MAG: DNA polymerase I [Cyanobacteria bacterium QS_4_48_99]|nr:MAG: DNA polymerase I [Cyanobacteria bacterium QS_4_48_99]